VFIQNYRQRITSKSTVNVNELGARHCGGKT